MTLLLLLLGCSSSGSGTDARGATRASVDAGPFAVVKSDGEQLSIEVRTGPDQPPTRGVSTVTLEISDATSGEPVDGLDLMVVPWMPAMGHGTSVKPAIDAKGNGQYIASRVNMYMGGKWDLRTAISGAVTDRATLHFSIR